MEVERRIGGPGGAPFPIHAGLAATLLAAHAPGAAPRRDPVVAHVLGTSAAYAFGDADTMATMMSRLGLEGCACVRLTETVDAMLVFSTAYLVQSRCGRVVVLCYRGTEPATVGSWLGDADVGAERMSLGGEPVAVHSGFRRNMRATRWAVLEQLRLALEGRSLLDDRQRVEHPLEALYVTGHSLGGAMAVLFALSLVGEVRERAVAERLRAIYTYGQPLVLGVPLPAAAGEVGRKLYRHVIERDPIPTLPAAPWGVLAHFGEEYRHRDGEWRRSDRPVEQLVRVREIPRSILASLATEKRRGKARYSIADHAPHHYVAALRPKGVVTELGDLES